MKLFLLIPVVLLISGCVYNGPTFLENKEAFIGRQVELEGRVVLVKKLCTTLVCDEDPCCNDCSATLGLQIGDEIIQLRGAHQGQEIKCKGTNCRMECFPEEGKAMGFAGKFGYDGEYYMEVS